MGLALLGDFFTEVDLLDQSHNMIAASESYCKDKEAIKLRFLSGVQDFKFHKQRKYNCIWAQSIMKYLKDEEVVAFLEAATIARADDSAVIIIKEELEEALGK